MPIEKSAGAIVFYNGRNARYTEHSARYKEEDNIIKYLFLKHKSENWNFPKGLIEEGENLEGAALRECKEETGLEEIELIPGFKETIKFFFKVKYDYQLERGFKIGQTVLKFVTYFLIQSKTKDVKISFEHEGYEWLTFEEALERLKKYKNSQEILKKANDFIIDKVLGK